LPPTGLPWTIYASHKDAADVQFSLDYLTHYHGTTNKDDRVKERVCWATTNIALQEYSSRDLTVVLQDNSEYETLSDGDKVFAFGGDYYVNAEATNAAERLRSGKYPEYKVWDTPSADRRNFLRDRQRQFCLNAFGFGIFERLPSPSIYTVSVGNIVSYRPGGTVVWDDTAAIERRVKSFCEKNLMSVDGLVLCRIEPPCFFEGDGYEWQKRIYTPFGGFGDPVGKLEDYYRTSEGLRELRDPKWRSRGASEVFFAPIKDVADEFRFRNARAAFTSIFEIYSWLDEQPRKKRRKAKAELEQLHQLYITHFDAIDEAVVDQAVDIMLPLAEDEEVRVVLEDWVDRPVHVPGPDIRQGPVADGR
jgi:hypothetical protein